MNLRFKKNDQAVSPVIAVILMVAITVVLAATVYVWVSGFSGSSGQPAKTMSLTSSGSIADVSGNATDQSKAFTVAAATPGLKWSDVTLSLDGATINCDDSWAGTGDKYRIRSGSGYLSCDDVAAGPASVISAGQTLEIYDDAGGLSGKTLRVLDTAANSLMTSVTIG